jgi:SpoVK/Ycf46/Vps4 family AAA+-type ATPase
MTTENKLINIKSGKAVDGLAIEKTHKNYWVIKQESIDRILIGSHDEDAVKKAAVELERIANWDTDKDVVEHLKARRNDLYSIFLNIKESHHTEYKLNVSYLDTKIEGGEVTYLVFDNGIERSVNGIFVTDGLCVHEEVNGYWTIDHVPSANMLSEFTSKEKAMMVAEKIKNMFVWSDRKVAELLSSSPEIREYLRQVREAAESGDEIPEMTNTLYLQLIFIQSEELKDKWPDFLIHWQKLENMIGLENVKEQVIALLEQIRGRMAVRHAIKETRSSMHMVFTGSPGTGKTEVARILGKLFYIMGYSKKDVFVEVDRSNIVGAHIGHTERNMKEIIEKSMGGMLLIDEAYALASADDSGDFGKEAIDVLIKAMEDNREDLIVVMTGYTNDMENLLQMNEGFDSRVRHRVHFRDYTPKQLAEIGGRLLVSKGYVVEEEVKDRIERAIKERAKDGVLKGNARDVRNIVDGISDEALARVGRKSGSSLTQVFITAEDVKNGTADKNTNADLKGLEEVREQALNELGSLIGMDDLKEHVARMLSLIEVEKHKFEMGIVSKKTRMHMIFAGPSGTGKTTVAKIIGKFLKGTGVLSSGHFNKVTRSDLVGSYQGHTAKAVREQVNKASGGVLLIDEAYNLVNGDGDTFGLEAVAELIDLMEEKKDDLVVILAGYEKPIQKLLSYNEGFKSRIAHNFVFPNYSSRDIFEITIQSLKNEQLVLSFEAEKVLQDEIEKASIKNGGLFDGNGRWANELVTQIKNSQGLRISPLLRSNELTKEDFLTITVEDIKNAIEYKIENA